MTIATGPVSGFALPLGGALCRLLEHDGQQNSRCAILATDGSADDIERLRNGEATLAIVQADVAANALNASGAFNGKPPFKDLRSLAGFYAETLTILVRSDGQVAQLDDLKGKRIAVGGPGLSDPLFTDFLDALGWTKSDLGPIVEMPRGDQIAALCSGGVAAVALTAPHPNGFVRSALAATCPITVLDLPGPGIDAVTAAHPAYAPTEMDIGAYAGPQKIIHSFGLRAVLVTTAKLDSETVTRLMAAVDKDGDELRKAHPAFAGLDRNEIFSSAGLPVERHAAASKYLADHKIGDTPAGN
jgi:TRAP transporter TAXI family solute receptor